MMEKKWSFKLICLLSKVWMGSAADNLMWLKIS